MNDAPSGADRLAARYWEALLEADPLQATAVGERGHDHRLPDISEAGVAADIGRFEAIRAEAATAAPDPADPEGVLTLATLRQAVDATLALLRADAHAYTVDATWGLQSQVLSVTAYQPLRDVEDGRAMVARWAAIAPLLDQMAANVRRGMADGRSPIRTSAARVVDQLTELLDAADADGPLLAPLKQGAGPGWAAEDWQRFAGELEQVVSTTVRPAMAAFRRFVADEVLPHARGGRSRRHRQSARRARGLSVAGAGPHHHRDGP